MKRPDLEFTAGDRVIKMTYGLQMDLQRLLPNATDALALLTTDPYLRDFVVRRTLTDSPKSVLDEDKLIDPGEIDLDPDQIMALLDWVAEHALYFFTKSAESASRLGGAYQKTLAHLMPSTPGSENSPSPTPSAGLGGASKETSEDSTSDTASTSSDSASD